VVNFRAVKNPAIWLAVAILNATIMGLIFSAGVNIDYGAFYSAGRAATEHPHGVYRQDVQFSSGIWSNHNKYLPYYHLPHELAIYAPLSTLPFSASLWLWRTISIVLLVIAALLSASIFGLPKLLTVHQFAAFFPVIHCICHGQDGILMLLLLTLSLYLLNRNEPFLAGAVLAIALFKPQVPVVVAIAMLMAGKRKFISGFAVTAASIVALCFAVFGPNWITDWLSLVKWSESHEIATQAVSIHGLLSMLGPFWGFAPAITVSLGLIVSRFRMWSGCEDQNLVFCSAIIVGSLAAFHFHIQDVSMLLLPIALLVSRGASATARWSLVPLFVSPLILFLIYGSATALVSIISIVLLGDLLRGDVNKAFPAFPSVPTIREIPMIQSLASRSPQDQIRY
jgi:hypothetical protein